MFTERLGKALAIGAVLVAACLVVPASGESKARIVRLSDVQGTVQMDRAAGVGFEKAFLNLPVIEGSRIRTGNDGRAEVEFEDGSALRIVPDSEIEFTRLALGDDGQKLNTVQLNSGIAYLNVRANKGDQFTLNFGHQSVSIEESAHFRVDLTATEATLAVFKGKVNGTGPAGQFEVAEKHSATFDLANSDSVAIAKNYEEDPYDDWDRQQSEYHDRYAKNSAYDMSSPYGYGLSDLNYYGNYMMVPGYGWVWQPFLAGASWSPWMDGAWAWYPGFGYMWVSGYPWGWMPYRYGNWAFVSGYGWVWQPGYWNTWYPVPRVVNPPVRTAVPTPPVRGHQTVVVGRGLTATPVRSVDRVSINPGSAGFGVPRGAVKNFDRVAKEAEKASRPVVVTTQSSAPVRTAPTTTAPTRAGSRDSWHPAPRTGPSQGGSRQVSAPRTSSPPHVSAPRSAPPSRPH
jgi:hypothetical protein